MSESNQSTANQGANVPAGEPIDPQARIGHIHLNVADLDRAISFYQTVLDHPAYDSYWKDLSVREKIEHVHVPVFSVGGWYDNFVESDLEAFAMLHKPGKPDTKHRIIIGPWPHCEKQPALLMRICC